jgi:hypothetical protein
MSESVIPGPRNALPENALRVKLPHSEVCMHMRLAGRDQWVAKVAPEAAQIYTDSGERFSAPILLAEAGLDEHGQPQQLLRPTSSFDPALAEPRRHHLVDEDPDMPRPGKGGGR